MRKTNVMVSALFLVGFTLPAFAGGNNQYYDEARVLSVIPQTERINEPRQECHTEYVRERVSRNNDRSVTGSIIGGVAGGLIGSRVGRGNGRIAAAALGAGVGAVVGDRLDNRTSNQSSYDRPIERCVTVDQWRTVERGYLVSYRYNGRDYSTVTNYRPGNTIRVSVAVVPADYDQVSYYEPAPTHVVYTEPRGRYGKKYHKRSKRRDRYQY